MRKRSDVKKPENATTQLTTSSSAPNEGAAPPAARIDIRLGNATGPQDTRIEQGAAALRANAPTENKQPLFPDDTVGFTAGEERYSLDEGDVVIGPIMVTTIVGPGERPEDAFARASVAANTMLEAEFRTKIAAFKKRSAEARK